MHRVWASCPQASTTQVPAPNPPSPPPQAPPASTTHLLRIVAVEVYLDSWVWDLLIDSYALHGDPWAQSKAENALFHCEHWAPS